MELLPIGLLALFATLTATLAQQEPQIAPHSAQQAPQSRSAPLLGVRYSASTDVSHISYNSPLVTYGSSLNEIQLPAAPIQPANLRQAPQEATSEGVSQEEQGQAVVRSGSQDQHQLQAQQLEPQNQVTRALLPQAIPDQQQFISIQQYPARPRLQSTPRGFSLNQNLPGPQPQAATRYAQQYSAAQAQPQVQQYVPAPAPQYSVSQPQQYVPQHQQVQYPSPTAYPSPSSNAYFATGPFAAQPVGPQYAQPASPQYAQYPQQVPPQYEQQYAQQGQAHYAQPGEQLAPQYAAQSAAPSGYSSAPATLVSRVAFNGPAASFSYGF